MRYTLQKTEDKVCEYPGSTAAVTFLGVQSFGQEISFKLKDKLLHLTRPTTKGVQCLVGPLGVLEAAYSTLENTTLIHSPNDKKGHPPWVGTIAEKGFVQGLGSDTSSATWAR